ncbi:DUF4913 domain-containing protein [Streptomyces sp. NPDC000594]|uniref:DUF4913 domain-containing protein n=1 Tax=Streptomyces sp. NPDC000594 TaxID=3154261 RepID=UPI00331711C9
MTVVRRGGRTVHTNELGADARWNRPVGAAEALVRERARPLSAAETGTFRRQLARQECAGPAGCGRTGPSTWHRDHLGPALRELRSSVGPIGGCTKGEHRITHRMPGLVPSAWSHGNA